VFRDATFNELERAQAIAAAEFVMDEDAFRAFYERTARGIWAYLMRITGDTHLADDLLQETYYRFLRASAAHQSESHRRNSLYTIATNLARDARRRSFTRPITSAFRPEIEPAVSGDHAAAAERRTDLDRAMARLNRRERAMLWLAYAEGASHNEIAGVLGVNPGSMKIMLFRARRRLAAFLRGPK
jgi:RNA polymerase sigma-70 factor (ECF subfamily)